MGFTPAGGGALANAVLNTAGDVTSPIAAPAGGRNLALRDVVSIMDFPGAHFDSLISGLGAVNDGTHSTSESLVWLGDYIFTVADVGKTIIVTDGGSTSNVTQVSITGVASGLAVLSAPVSWASPGFTNGTIVWGHDDSAAYQAALNYLANRYPAGGGTLELPSGNSLVLSQSTLNTTKPWALGIRGQGIGSTTIFVANATGWISVANNSRAAQCTISDFDLLACANPAGTGFAFTVPIGGNQQQSFWADRVLFNGLIPTVGYFVCPLNVLGTWRPELRDVFINERFGPNVSQAQNDDSPSFATTVGVVLDGCYTPHLVNCNVWSALRGYSHMVAAGTQGFYAENSQAVGCREGVWFESPDVEPQATWIGGHLNNRDVNIGVFQKKLTQISRPLFYNPYLVPSSSTTINQVGGIGAGDATVTITSVTNWPTSGGMLTIDSECMTYTGIAGNVLQGLVRGAYGTTAAAHANGATVYPPSYSATTAIIATGAITQATTIPVVNTAGMPRIGAVLIGSEWWTYDNLHQNIFEIGTVTAGTYLIHFTWNGNSFVTGAIAWNAGPATIAAAIQAAAPALPASQVICSHGNLPGTPTAVSAMWGITSVGPLVMTSIDSTGLTGGTYSVTSTDYAHNLTNLSRAAFGSVDPGTAYAAGTQVEAGVADVLVAGTSYGMDLADAQMHAQGHPLRKLLQVQDGAHDVTQSDNFLHPVGGYGAAIDGSASGVVIKDNTYSNFNVNPVVLPLLNGASDTVFRSARRRHVLANLSATQAITTAVVTTVANWQVVEDTDGFLTSGSVVTIPHNQGIRRVRVTASIAWQTTAGGGDRRIRIGQNGNFSLHGDAFATGVMTDQNVVQQSISGIFDVNDGDTISIQVEQTSGGTISINLSGSTFLEVEVMEG